MQAFIQECNTRQNGTEVSYMLNNEIILLISKSCKQFSCHKKLNKRSIKLTSSLTVSLFMLPFHEIKMFRHHFAGQINFFCRIHTNYFCNLDSILLPHFTILISKHYTLKLKLYLNQECTNT